jgi:hypothetical protein
MHGRKLDKFALRPKDKSVLRDLLHDGRTPIRVARRAEILLGRAEQQQRVVQLSEKVGENTSSIWRICERYQPLGLQAALYDAPRSGWRRVFFQKAAQAD